MLRALNESNNSTSGILPAWKDQREMFQARQPTMYEPRKALLFRRAIIKALTKRRQMDDSTHIAELQFRLGLQILDGNPPC